jgi:hypothetical protein
VNNDRRKRIASVRFQLDIIKREIDAKAAEEETGEAGNEKLLSDWEENWSSRVDDLRQDINDIGEDEPTEEAASALQQVSEDMDELVNVTETGAFVRLFHEKYDDMDSNLNDAAA